MEKLFLSAMNLPENISSVGSFPSMDILPLSREIADFYNFSEKKIIKPRRKIQNRLLKI